MTDYNFLLNRNKEVVSSVYEILEQEVSVIERVDACTAPVLYCLAVGGARNKKAQSVYDKMMEYAQQKGPLSLLSPFPYLPLPSPLLSSPSKACVSDFVLPRLGDV